MIPFKEYLRNWKLVKLRGELLSNFNFRAFVSVNEISTFPHPIAFDNIFTVHKGDYLFIIVA